MIEFPEAINIADALNTHVTGKVVIQVMLPTKLHKFCWFNGNPALYEDKIKNTSITSSQGFGIYVELTFSNNWKLCINDGVNVRLVSISDLPKDYQLLIKFTDGTALVFSVAMYGGIILHDGNFENDYYQKSKTYVSPLSPEFKSLFCAKIMAANQNLSAKAFLATEQRFPGIGNGVVQDILFEAGINPKRKLLTMSNQMHEVLYNAIVKTLREMTNNGGRDTEKDIFGNFGGYKTKLSKNTIEKGCPVCGNKITKEAYLGGSIYYCPVCQPLVK